MDNERIHYLNGLRGILAIIVFLHHFLYAFCPEVIFGGSQQEFLSGTWTISRLFAYTPLNLLFNPGMAISFFFLLSGYVQSYHYFKTNDTDFLRRSFVKRYFRLAAPVLAVVLLLFIFHRLHLIRNGAIPHHSLSYQWNKGMLLDNLNLWEAIKYGLVKNFSGDYSYYQILWTMSPELNNSWMVMILLMFTHGMKRRLGVFLLWFAVELFFIKHLYGMSFTLGIILCQLQFQSLKFNALIRRPVIKYLCLLVGLYFASFPFTGYLGATEQTMYRFISIFDKLPHVISFVIGNVLLFLFLMASPRAQAFLSKPVMLFFGEISFLFYLVHFLLVFSFSPWLYQLLVPYLMMSANLWLTGLATFGVITLVSYILYRLVDKPVIQVCNRYSKKLFSTPAPAGNA